MHANGTATTKPGAGKWSPGDTAKIRDVPHDARTWYLGSCHTRAKPVTLEPGDTISLFRKADGCCDDEWWFRSPKLPVAQIVDEATIEPVEPEHAAHPWAPGDRARIDQPSHFHHGSEVTLMRRHLGVVVRKPYWQYVATGGHDQGLGVYEEYLIPAVSPEPAPGPSPALYHMEYDVTDVVPCADEDGDPLVDSLVTSRRAALVPIPGPAERAKLAEALEALHDLDEGHEEFILGYIGGVPAEPHAVGDRVTIVGGEHHGQAFYLIERDAANGMRWWLSRKPGGEGWLGLHVDRFTRDERVDA